MASQITEENIIALKVDEVLVSICDTPVEVVKEYIRVLKILNIINNDELNRMMKKFKISKSTETFTVLVRRIK